MEKARAFTLSFFLLTVKLKVQRVADTVSACTMQAIARGGGRESLKLNHPKEKKMESKIKSFELGHGARGTGGINKVARLRALGVSKGLAALAKRCAAARARKLEALESRTVEVSTVQELECIYRAEFARAWMTCGKVVNLRKIYQRRKRGTVNPYSFRVRLAWFRAIRAAMSASRAEIYRSHKVSDETATMADLIQLRDIIQGNWGGVRTSEIVEAPALASAHRDRGGWMSSARIVRHARECLVVHWSLAGGQRWKSGLAEDLRLMTDCLKVARGEGHEKLGTWDNWNNSAQRRAIARMQARIDSGDVLMTDKSQESESVLQEWQGVRAMSRRSHNAAMAAEKAAFMICS